MIDPYDYLGRIVYIPREEDEMTAFKTENSPKSGPWVQKARITELLVDHKWVQGDPVVVHTSVQYKLEYSSLDEEGLDGYYYYTAWIPDTSLLKDCFLTESVAWMKVRYNAAKEEGEPE